MCKSVEYTYGYKTYKNVIGIRERHQQLDWESSPWNSSARQQQNNISFSNTFQVHLGAPQLSGHPQFILDFSNVAKQGWT